MRVGVRVRVRAGLRRGLGLRFGLGVGREGSCGDVSKQHGL